MLSWPSSLIPIPYYNVMQVDLAKLDYHHYLAMFFDGIREMQEP